jgi:hypothetical protein
MQVCSGHLILVIANIPDMQFACAVDSLCEGNCWTLYGPETDAMKLLGKL